jgi:hypothetical protein
MKDLSFEAMLAYSHWPQLITWLAPLVKTPPTAPAAEETPPEAADQAPPMPPAAGVAAGAGAGAEASAVGAAGAAAGSDMAQEGGAF